MRAICLGALLLAGCAARQAGMELAREHFEAPAAVVHVAWSHPLITQVPFLQYLPQEFASAAAGDNGLVYIGSSAKKFYALRPDNGDEVWSHELSGGVASQPLYLPPGLAAAAALVVVGDDDGALTALDAATGAQRWVYRVRGTIRVPPTYSDGMLYFESGEGRLYAVDARTGQERWRYEREVPESFTIRGSAGALISGGRAYAGFPDGYLVSLNAASGEVQWARQLSGEATRFTDVDSTPALGHDTLYATSYSGGVYALDPKDGSIRWRHEMEDAGPLTLDPAAGRLYVVAARTGVACLDLDGRVLWRQALAQQGELSAPTLWGRYLLFSAAGGGAYVVEARSGDLLQFFDPGHGVSGKLVAAARTVYLLSNVGVFYALRAG